MSKSFEIKLQRPASDIINDAKTTAQRKGIKFEGDTEKGAFSGMGIDGSYSIAGDILSVQVSKKPIVLTWDMIESAVRGYFAG